VKPQTSELSELLELDRDQLVGRLLAAERALEFSVRQYNGSSYCPFCLELAGQHTGGCLYAAWLRAREGTDDGD